MAAIILTAVLLVIFTLAYAAWRRYLWAARQAPIEATDTCPYSLTDVFGERHLVNVPHQQGVQWLNGIFSRSVDKYPHLTALQIPHTGESLSFAELDTRAERVAAALASRLTGPDQVVAVSMPQDSWHIVAAHLGVLKAGGTLMFLDASLPEALIDHMVNDARPVAVLTRGQEQFRDLPTLNILTLPENTALREPPCWLDDPAQRLAAIFYTSGTTGKPKGVECHHAGYVNLALTYADFFDLAPGQDATTLTSSMAYDGSISELYSAWVSGCSVVMLTNEQVRSGPDLLPVLRDAEVTVLFCPPVLLATLTHNPELDLPHPICRYIVPAGEAFPSALVEPWTRARRQIINTYGPTEASTDTSRQSLRPGEPVTIGSPFANVTYVILDADGSEPLPHGEAGELCIGGIHLARGYRNLPELTEQKFITHSRFGRLYRTGDRCRIDARTQRVHFLGRIDSQLKVRGHRVETQAVEDILQTQFREIEAAVLDYQNEELVAFVTAASIKENHSAAVTPAPAAWAESTRMTLARQLPAPSVPNRIFLVENFVMKPLSGKIDREQLPRLSQLAPAGPDDPENQLARTGSPEASDCQHGSRVDEEPECGEVLSICRDVFETQLEWDDVFADHGGHSIVIAQLAQRLQAAGWAVSVRALLSNCNTARKVAGQQRQPQQFSRPPATATDSCRDISDRHEAAAKVLSPGLFTTLQALFLALLYSPPLIGFLALVALAEIGEFFMTAGLWEFVGVGVLGYLLALVYPFASLLWVMVIKLFMGGHFYRNRVKPGAYPKWSRMHLRVWCIGRLENLVLLPLGALFRSGPLMAYVLRRLGASVGDNLQCSHDVALSGPLDLLSIGNDVAIQTGASLQMSRWCGQELLIGPVRLENACRIGMRAAVVNGVTVGKGSWISPFTPILEDVGQDQLWEGAPARMSGRCTTLRRTRDYCRPARHLWFMEMLNILLQLLLDFCLIVVPTAAVTWFAVTFIPAGDAELSSQYFRVTPLGEIVWHMGLYAFVTTWVTIVLISVLICLFLRWTPASPGLYSPRSLRGYLLLYRIKKFNLVQKLWTWTITGQYLRALAGVRFSHLGASECDVMFNLVPELASADTRVFWSNGCFTNMLEYSAGHITLRQLDMPGNFFSGNNSVVESGQLPSNFLLGVSTPGNDIQFRRQMRSRPGEPIIVAGNPPVKFASADSENENEIRNLPSLSLFLARVFLNDILGIGVLLNANILVYVILYTSLLRLGGQVLVSALVALMLSELFLLLACAAVKKLLVGSQWGASHSTPFWSWRHFSYFFTQDCFFAWCGGFLKLFAGTRIANTVLRLMGCGIGKRTIVSSPLQASDWNAVSFGNDCMVNGFLQLHTFENMTLKAKLAEIRDGCAINSGATVMGGAIIEPGTTLQPLSLVLKEMHLPTGSYEGSPVERVANSPGQ